MTQHTADFRAPRYEHPALFLTVDSHLRATRRIIFLDDRLDVIVKTLNKIYQTNIRLASEGLAA